MASMNIAFPTAPNNMRLSLRPDLPPKLLVGSTWLLALALSAWIAATWYWHLSGTPVQSAQPSPVSDPLAAAQDIASRQLFGASVSAVPVEAAQTQNLMLMGVSTRWGKLPGFAVIKDGTFPSGSFIEGEEIAPGVKLLHVLPDSIEIDRNGTREQIRLSASPRMPGDVIQGRTNPLGQPAQPNRLNPSNQAVGGSTPASDNQ
ncbi:MAG: alpha,2-mannosidase [Rhodocyclales bacterium]|nr:alpha,2-mannosidase [Rhodocyclales bacterium]